MSGERIPKPIRDAVAEMIIAIYELRRRARERRPQLDSGIPKPRKHGRSSPSGDGRQG